MDFNAIMEWIIKTPSLFHDNNPVVSRSPFPVSDIPSVEFSGKYTRLGFLYQDLCARLFNNHPAYTIEGEEIQLTENGRTIGAIDFIVKNHAKASMEHWEVAVKFYLLHHQKWYGPNAKDRLDKKLHHMLSHQLKLSEHSLFTEHYPHWQNLTHHLLMQGRLYINPFAEEPIPEACLGYQLNQSQIAGFWCYQSQTSQIRTTLYTLEKNQWMTGHHHFNLYQPSHKGFSHCISADNRFWFIVPDTWPDEN